MNFNETVPFDPGYSDISFSFANEIAYMMSEYQKIKAPHQKKFQLLKLKPAILDLINKNASFYLGCMLWGGFLSQRFKNNPKEISGNKNENLSKEEANELDCAAEVKYMLEFIPTFDRDCKYFLKTPAQIPQIIFEIIDGYIEFAKINNNFFAIKNTSDIKIPQAVNHFKDLSDEQLDNLCEKIYQIITSRKIEQLLEIGFYKV